MSVEKATVEISNTDDADILDCSVKITVHYLYSMQSDFSDVYFKYTDDLTLLNHFKESYITSTYAIFWVKVPTVYANSTSSIYMYWHDSYTPVNSPPADMFISIDSVKYYWDFDDDSVDTVYDKSGNNINGVLQSMPVYVEGKYNKSIYFDGIDDLLACSYTKVGDNFSVSFWMKAITTHEIDAESSSGTAGVVGQKYIVGPNWEGSYAGFGISAGTNGISVYGHGASFLPALAVYNGSIGTDWNHVVVTVTNKQPRIYLNGVLVRTGVVCTTTLYSPFYVGGYDYGCFNGTLDDFCVFTSVLTEEQISGLYLSRLAHFSSSAGTVYLLPNIQQSLNVAIFYSSAVIWLQGWKNRAMVEIVNFSTSQTLCQVEVSFNYKPGMQSDFSDIRFTDIDGVTELNYFRGPYTLKTSAVFYVKVPIIKATPKVTAVFMYWDNDSVSTTSSVSNTFLDVIDNTLCYWDFDEDSGTVVYDKLSSLVNGTLNGDALRMVQSNGDNHIYFDGVNDYMSWLYTKPSNNFSISFWMKAITTHEIDAESSSGTAGGVGQKYVIGITSEGTNAGLGISAGTNGISVYGHGASFLPALAVYNGSIGTDWNHVVVTVTNKQPRIYLNGVLVRTGVVCTKTYLYGPSRLGGDSVYGYFNGYVDDVCIFNSVLTQTQINYLYSKSYCLLQNYQGVLIKNCVSYEPIVEHVAYTSGNICSKNPYVFSCSLSGINIFDLDTLGMINHIDIDKLNSIWANDEYLFAATSNSGIYKYALATVSTTPIKEVFKQQPYITSNSVRYLNGSGDYLCAVTLSGIDRYNLNTGNRYYVGVFGANKCFQTSRGDFYYDTYSNLVANYHDTSSFIYSPYGPDNVLQSYNIYDIDNNFIINDLYVTENTSSRDDANTIFLATSHGVIVIEEKRGDEENANHRYYLKTS